MTTTEIVKLNNKKLTYRIVRKISILEICQVNEKTNVHNETYHKPISK